MIEHLYVHIPFCDHICFYCDFFKIKKSRSEMIDEYLQSLALEINAQHPLFKLKTIYLGGGTPNSLNDKQLTYLLTLLQQVDQFDVTEYTIELNPESITDSQLKILKKFNINRLSIGIQTFNDKLLKKINRHHSVQDAIKSFHLARENGFNNISFDLIYNLFNQIEEDIYQDLEMVKLLRPDHISWYSLILKKDSYWGKRKLKLPDYDVEYDKIVNEELKKLGYQRYEISNYCLNNLLSQHNLGYWTNKSFWPFGPGATGFMNEPDHYLVENSRKYAEWIQTKIPITIEDYYFQILMMGLRIIKGINLEKVKDARKAFEHYQTKIEAEILTKHLELVDNHLRCTPLGLDLLNDILVRIM